MPKVVSDRILSLSSPTVTARKARVLVRDDQSVAVFTTVGPPTTQFTITGSSNQHFTLDDGSQVRFRAVGSSCSWALAKCRVSTQQLEARWTS